MSVLHRLSAWRPVVWPIAVWLLVALIAGCDRNDGPRPASTGPTARAAAEETVAPVPSAVSGPATLREIPSDTSLNGFVAIDPTTGGVTPIWIGTARMTDIDIYPTLVPRGNAVWLSWEARADESVRFDLAGVETDRVPGVWADESSDGGVVLYYRSDTGGQHHLVARYPDRTVDLGVGCCGAVGQGGRVAFLAASEGGVRSLRVYDPATDETWTVADGIGRPGKDGVVYPAWSPSGRFVSDFSFNPADPERSYRILADTVTREVRTTASDWFWQRGPTGEDWMGTLADGGVVFLDAVSGVEVLRLSVPDRTIVSARELGGAIEVTASGTDASGKPVEAHVVFDVNGRELGRWEGRWYISMTPDGPAAARGFVEADCQAIEVDHPRFKASLPCAATQPQWSPDGRFVVVQIQGKPTTEIRIVELSTGTTRSHTTQHRAVAIAWSGDGSRLVVRLGGGL